MIVGGEHAPNQTCTACTLCSHPEITLFFPLFLVIRLHEIRREASFISETDRRMPACLTLTSTFLQGSALGVLPQLHLSVFGQFSQRGGLSLLVLFALAAIVAAFRLPLPLLLLLPT